MVMLTYISNFLIEGYIGYFNITINKDVLQFYLISRRSNKRAGTRYNARGKFKFKKKLNF